MKMKLTNWATLLFATLFLNTGQMNGKGAPTNMSWIPPGSFVMGNCMVTNEGSSDELPLHAVYVSASYVDKYEVTKALWDEVYNWSTNHGYSYDNVGSWFDGVNYSRGTNHPVHTINWYDAVKWCNARSEKEMRTPAYYTGTTQTNVYRVGQINIQNSWVKWGAGYRLPTEAEWEKSARGGENGHRFPWSNVETITHSQANYNSLTNYEYDISPTRGHHPTFAIGSFRVLPYTSPVGYFTANDYNLYDMAGNVWEWCWDLYGTYSSGSQTNPLGATSGSFRMLRGGSWKHTALDSRTASRLVLSPGGNSIAYPSFIFFGLGFRTVLPSALPFETEAVLNTPSTQEVYTCSITRKPGKTNLVIVTHGWIRKEIGQTSPPNPDWVDGMTNLIQNYITSHGLSNWQVEAFKWKDKAWFYTPLTKLLDNAEKEGGSLGDCIGGQGWSHIHLIGHSAGAALIQSATLNIKIKNANTEVHTTFLDPYVGFTYGGKKRYGLAANWSDSYFAWDSGTDEISFGRTATKLDHAYNVEVTWLDTNKVPIGAYRSTAGGEIEECFETVSSHSWPYGFYANTITPNTQQGAQGFGFPLSKEGGNWNFATNNYSIYTDSVRVLGTPDPPCFTFNDASLVYPSLLINFNQAPSVTSTTGSVENNGLLLILSGTGSSQIGPRPNGLDPSSTPAWLATVLAVTNKINFVSFDAKFTSTDGAEGVLSVCWDTNSIGTIDERVVVPGLWHYTYSLPQTVTNGTHTLGFRLDSFTSTLSSVMVTNVALGFVGIPDPFSLSIARKDTNGFVQLKLTGPSGFNYTVETSTNFVDWTSIALLINTNGVVPFVDRKSSNSPARFYRAVGY